MRHDSHYLLAGPGQGPLARFLGALAAAAALAVSLLLGFVFFLVLLAVGLVVGTLVWWQLRRLRRDIEAQIETPGGRDETVLEGDFEVVSDEQRRDR